MSPFTVMPIQIFNWTSRPRPGLPGQRRRRRLGPRLHDPGDERPGDLAALSPAPQHQVVTDMAEPETRAGVLPTPLKADAAT
jgi:hypothetical protein